ncbi:Uncharacterised protein [Streptococcus acidominimus]|uniref:Uncharacterized protein n=1 Tax=Streptococcus acidominimus TaxID=1326 RepID=A0A239XNF0_STRAI|nr:Uncharacterised protein [Streptococcus acidominimus]
MPKRTKKVQKRNTVKVGPVSVTYRNGRRSI